MNKKTLAISFFICFLIGLFDFLTTNYGLINGLIEADGVYYPFLSTFILFFVMLFVDFIYNETKFKSEIERKFFSYLSLSLITFLVSFMIFPIINNIGLII